MLDLFVVLPAIGRGSACVPALVFTEFGDLAGEAIYTFPVPLVREMFLILGLYIL
jgi:hypothetical protein